MVAYCIPPRLVVTPRTNTHMHVRMRARCRVRVLARRSVLMVVVVATRSRRGHVTTVWHVTAVVVPAV